MKPSESLTTEEHCVTDLDCPLAENATSHPRRSGLRYSFVATIEVVDPKSAKQIVSITSNLSRSGCHIRTGTPFEPETRVELTIRHEGRTFRSDGVVVYAIPAVGMGIRFENSEGTEHVALNEWLMQVSHDVFEPRIPSQQAPMLKREIVVVLSIAALAAIVGGMLAWLGVLR